MNDAEGKKIKVLDGIIEREEPAPVRQAPDLRLS
jgi:hypothetical protein